MVIAGRGRAARAPVGAARESAAAVGAAVGSATPAGVRRGALAALLLSTFIGYLDTFVVNVAAPAIQSDLHASFTEVQLTIAGYTAAYATGLVVGGRLGDCYGHRRLWLLGMAGFALTSLAASAAPNGALLVLARVAQGLAAAAALPQVLAIVRVVAGPGDRQRRALAWYGAVAGLAALSGQLVGGVLLDWDVDVSSWRLIFLVNVPVVAVALLVGVRCIPRTRARTGGPVDVRGALLFAAALGAALIPLVTGPTAGWSPWLIALVAVGAVAGLLFTRHEHAEEHVGPQRPLLRLSLLRLPTLRWGLLVVFAYFGGNAGLFLTLAYYEQTGLGLSPLASGATFLPLGLGFIAASSPSARLLARWGGRVLVVGAVLVTAGLAVIGASVVSGPRHPVLVLGLAVNGLGQGLLDVPLFGVILAPVSASVAGAASGLLMTTTQVAAVLSVAVTGALFASRLRAAPPPSGGGPAAAGAYTGAFEASLVLLTALAALTVATVVRLHRTGLSFDRR